MFADKVEISASQFATTNRRFQVQGTYHKLKSLNLHQTPIYFRIHVIRLAPGKVPLEIIVYFNSVYEL